MPSPPARPQPTCVPPPAGPAAPSSPRRRAAATRLPPQTYARESSLLSQFTSPATGFEWLLLRIVPRETIAPKAKSSTSPRDTTARAAATRYNALLTSRALWERFLSESKPFFSRGAAADGDRRGDRDDSGGGDGGDRGGGRDDGSGDGGDRGGDGGRGGGGSGGGVPPRPTTLVLTTQIDAALCGPAAGRQLAALGASHGYVGAPWPRAIGDALCGDSLGASPTVTRRCSDEASSCETPFPGLATPSTRRRPSLVVVETRHLHATRHSQVRRLPRRVADVLRRGGRL